MTEDVDKLERGLGLLPQPSAHPALIALSGLPGTGKSYVAASLADRFPSARLESDAMRKELVPAPDYSPEENARVFAAALTQRLLARGIGVIFDATNLAERHRAILRNIAAGAGADFFLVRVIAPRRLVRARLETRRSDSDNLSDADWRVFKEMEATEEKTRLRHFVVDTSKDIEPAVERIVRAIKGTVEEKEIDGD